MALAVQPRLKSSDHPFYLGAIRDGPLRGSFGVRCAGQCTWGECLWQRDNETGLLERSPL